MDSARLANLTAWQEKMVANGKVRPLPPHGPVAMPSAAAIRPPALTDVGPPPVRAAAVL